MRPPQPDTIDYAIRRWEASKDTRSERGAGDEMAVLLRQISRQAKTTPAGVAPVEAVLAPETYTKAGLPRRAASRAREHGAIITYLMDAIQVEFPHGARIVQRVDHYRGGQPVWTRLERHSGAAPGTDPAPGKNIEEVLNRFADNAEGRN